MKGKITKLSSILLLTAALLTACNESGVTETKISEGYNVQNTDGGGYDLMPFKGEFHAAYTKEEYLSNNKTINTQKISEIAENQWITSFNAPIDPTHPETVFLSTTVTLAANDPSGKIPNRILSYDLETGAVAELYIEKENRIIRTLGMDGNKLIVLNDLIDNSPGPCSSAWLFDGPQFTYSYLDITNPEAGLQPYTLPKYQIEKATTAADKCLQEMDVG